MRRLIPLLLIAGFASSTAQGVSPTPVSGTFTFSGSITVHETVTSSETVYCEVTLSTSDEYGINSEDVIISATQSSGELWTCAPVIYYLWHLDTPTTDPVTISFSVGIGPSSGVTSKASLTRSGTHYLPSLTSVPPTGSSWSRAMGTAL